ncbi:MAG: type II toxin-antitoxin system prevent-host-death family antitoxin [Treponema sp.]|jgi:prevent-host-death family protein|nr:type II toxin-antitoxin system prevent-host-death family antitoxin [Treponema sp.]
MTVGAFQAKTHFSQIIADVEVGNDYIITKRGKPVAQIIPFVEPQKTRQEGIENLRKMAKKYFKGKPFTAKEIREMIDEGRP